MAYDTPIAIANKTAMTSAWTKPPPGSQDRSQMVKIARPRNQLAAEFHTKASKREASLTSPVDLRAKISFSLRRHYPDQVQRVDGGIAVLSAEFPQLPYRYMDE